MTLLTISFNKAKITDLNDFWVSKVEKYTPASILKSPEKTRPGVLFLLYTPIIFAVMVCWPHWRWRYPRLRFAACCRAIHCRAPMQHNGGGGMVRAAVNGGKAVAAMAGSPWLAATSWLE